MHGPSIHLVWHCEAALWHRHALNGRRPRRAALYRVEFAGAAQRQAMIPCGLNLRALPRKDERELPGLEVGDFDLAFEDFDATAFLADIHAELGAFDDGGEIRCLDLEVFDV